MKLIGLAIFLAMSAQARDDLCDLPPEQGYCRGYFRRYYFDEATQRCADFIFGGCGGNRNNFVFLEHCQEMCEDEADDTSTSESSSVSTTTSFTDTSSNVTFESDLDSHSSTGTQNLTAEVFEDSDNYTPEDTSQNTTALSSESDMNVTEEEESPDSVTNSTDLTPTEPVPSLAALRVTSPDYLDTSSADCASLPDRGLCRGLFIHFFYNPVRERCEEFIYGGCGGNGNNYQREDQCRKACFMPVNMHAAATLKSTSITSEKTTTNNPTTSSTNNVPVPVVTVTHGTPKQTTSGVAMSNLESSFEDLTSEDTTKVPSPDSQKTTQVLTEESDEDKSPDDIVIQDFVDNSTQSGNMSGVFDSETLGEDTLTQNSTDSHNQTGNVSQEIFSSNDTPADEVFQPPSGTFPSSGKPTSVSAETPKETPEGLGITQVSKTSSDSSSTLSTTT
ncbi:papilin-like [Haliotis rufescens]|uniref:papilin-like n=1 Tax=Haliotis rufescens TaxID=6454 RepID=UPI00201F1B1D|nr:papilin-like [Haliotis rufescens]